MLARAAARSHEMSLRVALGASRIRLACQLLVESLLLAAAGGAAGLAIANAGAALLIRQLGSDASSVTLDLSLDWRVLGFTAAASLGAMLLFGVAPAFGIRAVRPNDALKEQGRSVAGDRRARFRHALIVVQVALSFVLLAGAGLFVRTFSTLISTPLGFDPAGLMIVDADARPGQSRARTDRGIRATGRRGGVGATRRLARIVVVSHAAERPELDPSRAGRGRTHPDAGRNRPRRSTPSRRGGSRPTGCACSPDATSLRPMSRAASGSRS